MKALTRDDAKYLLLFRACVNRAVEQIKLDLRYPADRLIYISDPIRMGFSVEPEKYFYP